MRSIADTACTGKAATYLPLRILEITGARQYSARNSACKKACASLNAGVSGKGNQRSAAYIKWRLCIYQHNEGTGNIREAENGKGEVGVMVMDEKVHSKQEEAVCLY